MKCQLLQLLIALVSINSAAANFRLRSPWSWRCDRNITHARCVREELMSISVSTMSLQTCKLTCDKYGALWPKPQDVVLGERVALFLPTTITKTFTTLSQEDSVLLEAAFQIFLESLNQYHPDYKRNKSVWTQSARASLNQLEISVTLTKSKSRLGLNVRDEEYTLQVDTIGDKTVASIRASTYFGARHALETLSQLIEYEENEDSLMIVSAAEVTDAPVFAYRGILLDTSRNFYSVESIERVMDAMAMNKLNTFHWHLTDTNSFPVALRTLPKVTYYGAHTGRQVYYPEDIRHLVEYGRIRGIRVLPEFDAPAHVGHGWQWGPQEGLGNLAVCVDREPWQKYCWQPPCGQLNIANENMYTVLGRVYEELADMFGPLDLFHYGGDEVNMNCWNTTTEVREWMEQQGSDLSFESYFDKWSQFQDRAFNLFTKANKGVPIPGILWTSHLTDKNRADRYLNRENYIIQIWNSNRTDPNIASILNKNFSVIFSNYDAWYLDCGFSAWVGEGNNWCAPYKGWQKVYNNNPIEIAQTLTNNTANLNLILGGEACLWSEQVDENVVDGRLWPRGAALAERLWSNPDHGWGPAETRMINHRQRMVKRGIQADRLQPQWCHHNEGLCYRDWSIPRSA